MMEERSEMSLIDDNFRLFGMFLLHRPVFVIRDVGLIRQILVDNFDCFGSYAGDASTDKSLQRSPSNVNQLIETNYFLV